MSFEDEINEIASSEEDDAVSGEGLVSSEDDNLDDEAMSSEYEDVDAEFENDVKETMASEKDILEDKQMIVEDLNIRIDLHSELIDQLRLTNTKMESILDYLQKNQETTFKKVNNNKREISKKNEEIAELKAQQVLLNAKLKELQDDRMDSQNVLLNELRLTISRMENVLGNYQEKREIAAVKMNEFKDEISLKHEQIEELKLTDDGSKTFKLITRAEFIRHIESPDTKAKSLVKLLLAFLYCSISLLITAFVMVLVHDRVPDMKTYPPLPDLVLDNLPLIPWAFEVCEMIAVAMAMIWFTILFFHKERIVLMRRMFSLVGTVFLLRCVTMLITSLSVPGIHLSCRAKSYASLGAKLQQAFHIWSRLGMSIQGVRSCGDYMFSGHTTAITLLNHFITEYTPVSWNFLHTATWVMNFFGIFFILAGHEHYSIDVFIAFYISSRMFLYYHTYAYNHNNLTTTDSRMRLWFPLGWFFEAGGCGRVVNDFDLPFTSIVQCFKFSK